MAVRRTAHGTLIIPLPRVTLVTSYAQVPTRIAATGWCRRLPGITFYPSAVYTPFVREATRIGLLGGTFDPPHVGHLVAAANVRQALHLDRVLLVVANQPWQKVGVREITPAVDRLAMVQALANDVPGVEASTIEIERGGPSYTTRRSTYCVNIIPIARCCVILGRDVAAGLPTWERAQDVRDNAVMVLVERPGAAPVALPEDWTFEHVVIPYFDISSTEVRQRIAEGRPIDGLVPPEVISVIAERGLYRGAQV